MAGNHGLLACKNNADLNPAVLSVDGFARLIICRAIDPHSQPMQPFACSFSYLGTVLTDAAGENQAFQTAKRTGYGRDFPGDAKRE